jgi:hypothetical protein
MVNVITLANQLNKDYDYIKQLCYNCEIPIHADKEGEFISDEDAKLFMNNEVSVPTRYNKRGMECLDITNILSGDNNIQYFYLGCIMKYLYRRMNVTDLKKARTYLDKWIENAEKQGVIK